MYSAIFDAYAQTAQPENEENARMILAYTFYLKQKMSLEFISSRFPTLKDYVESTTTEWNREFIASVKNIDSALTSNLNDEWLKNKNALYEKFIRADYSGVSEENASQFIDIVNDRTYGHIQTPILETFLIWNPRYRKNPETEFTDGYVRQFSTKEMRSYLGINIKIVYPRSWKAIEGNKKSNVAQNFISGYGLGDVTLSLVIEKSKTNYTKEKINQLLTKESLVKSIRANGKFLDYTSNFTIDNCLAAIVTSYFEKDVENEKKAYFVNELYITYYKNFKISFNFMISAQNTDNLNDKIKKYRNLFKRIVDNVVILSQWGQ
jgi:hypothetical protein